MNVVRVKDCHWKITHSLCVKVFQTVLHTFLGIPISAGNPQTQSMSLLFEVHFINELSKLETQRGVIFSHFNSVHFLIPLQVDQPSAVIMLQIDSHFMFTFSVPVTE